MLKNLTFFLFVFCFLTMSCREENLEGHWHVYNNSEKSDNYFTVDFDKDSSGVYGKYSISEPSDCSYDIHKKKIYFNNMGVYGIFDYVLKNDSLFLKNDYDWNWVGKKIRHLDSTDFIQDHFSNIDLKIQLVEVDTLKIESEPFDKKMSQSIFLGYPIHRYMDYHNHMLLQLGDQFANLLDLHLWNENSKVSKPEYLIPFIPYVLFIHREVKLEEIKPIIDELKRIEIKDEKIFIACLTPNPTDLGNPFRLLHYKNINFDNLELTLQESIDSF